jgi:hypothetical protein
LTFALPTHNLEIAAWLLRPLVVRGSCTSTQALRLSAGHHPLCLSGTGTERLVDCVPMAGANCAETKNRREAGVPRRPDSLPFVPIGAYRQERMNAYPLVSSSLDQRTFRSVCGGSVVNVGQHLVLRSFLKEATGQRFLRRRSIGRGWPSKPSTKTVIRKRRSNSSLRWNLFGSLCFFQQVKLATRLSGVRLQLS